MKKQKRYGLGEFNCPVHLIFTHDKNGRPIAYRYHGGCFNKHRIGMVLAKAIEAADEAATVTYK